MAINNYAQKFHDALELLNESERQIKRAQNLIMESIAQIARYEQEEEKKKKEREEEINGVYIIPSNKLSLLAKTRKEFPNAEIVESVYDDGVLFVANEKGILWCILDISHFTFLLMKTKTKYDYYLNNWNILRKL
jgi:hypothetical protein